MTVVLHAVLIRVEKLDECVRRIVLLLLLVRMLQRADSDVVRNASAVVDSAHQGAHFHGTSSAAAAAAAHVMMAVLLVMLQRVVVMVVVMRQVIRWTVNIVAVHLIKKKIINNNNNNSKNFDQEIFEIIRIDQILF